MLKTELTDSDRQVAQQLGIPLDEFAKTKAAMQGSGRLPSGHPPRPRLAKLAAPYAGIGTSAPAPGAAALTDSDRGVAQQLGIPLDDFARHKAAMRDGGHRV